MWCLVLRGSWVCAKIENIIHNGGSNVSSQRKKTTLVSLLTQIRLWASGKLVPNKYVQPHIGQHTIFGYVSYRRVARLKLSIYMRPSYGANINFAHIWPLFLFSLEINALFTCFPAPLGGSHTYKLRLLKGLSPHKIARFYNW